MIMIIIVIFSDVSGICVVLYKYRLTDSKLQGIQLIEWSKGDNSVIKETTLETKGGNSV